MVPSCQINYQKFGEFMQNYNEKTDFHVQLLTRDLVPDRQGSAAHEITNHWISPTLNRGFKEFDVKIHKIFLMNISVCGQISFDHDDFDWKKTRKKNQQFTIQLI